MDLSWLAEHLWSQCGAVTALGAVIVIYLAREKVRLERKVEELYIERRERAEAQIVDLTAIGKTSVAAMTQLSTEIAELKGRMIGRAAGEDC